MPDWQRLVRRRLSGLTLNAAERDEVQAELATHLEESYEVFRAEGLPEYEAVQRTLSQIADWKDLQRKIDSARIGKDTMTNRVTQLWLPGLLTFALSMGLLELVQKFGPRPIILNLDQGTPVLMFYTSWLLILPLAGALGAYLSKRAGGSVRMVLASSIFHHGVRMGFGSGSDSLRGRSLGALSFFAPLRLSWRHYELNLTCSTNDKKEVPPGLAAGRWKSGRGARARCLP